MRIPARSRLSVAIYALGGVALAVLVYAYYSSKMATVVPGNREILSPKTQIGPPKEEPNRVPLVATVDKPPPLSISRVDWAEQYNQTGDYFSFVLNASKSALNGDGRAALYVSKALYKCSPIAKHYANSTDPEADFNAYWAGMTKAPQSIVDMARRDFKACTGFIKGDAFASLPNRTGGYNSIGFWTEQASASNDPVARSMDAGNAVGTTFQGASRAGSESIEAAQLMVNNAVASRDPAALFKIGQLLSDGHASSDPLQGIAVSIAACDMGYNCTANNVEIFGDCVAQGECASGMNYSDQAKKLVGEEGYLKAYVRAQQLEDAISRGDSNAIRDLVKLNPVQ